MSQDPEEATALGTANAYRLWSAFTDFYRFAPTQQSVIFALMIAQGFTTGVGLLLIVPLLQIVGVDMGMTTDHGIATTAGRVYALLGVELNLVNVLISYVLIVTAIASLRYRLSVMTTRVQQSYITFLRNKLYRSLLNTSWQFIVQSKMSDFIHCLTGQVQGIGHASQLLLTLISQLVLTLIMVVLAMLLSWQMTVLAIAFSGVLLTILLPLNKIIYGSGRRQLLSFKSIFQLLTEQLGSLKMIKSYASENYHAGLLQHTSEQLEEQLVNLHRMNALTQWIYAVGAVIAFSVFFYIAQARFAIPLTTILLLLLIFSRLLPQISSLQKTFQQLLHQVPAFDDVNALLKACQAAQEAPRGDAQYPAFTRAIRMENVCYRYPVVGAMPVLENFSLQIDKNATVALIGASGAGKSTLADLLAGLLIPEQGHIFVDDVELSGERRLAWRQHVAYVTQDVFLFHDTVRANLSWVAKGDVSDDDLWRVLALAAAEFVGELPQGLDTVIGDRGMRLSGGERQRLALARALLSEPQLLILDEATSALDDDNEKKIRLALEKLHGSLTIVIIAHRDTTIAHADKRVNLHG